MQQSGGWGPLMFTWNAVPASGLELRQKYNAAPGIAALNHVK